MSAPGALQLAILFGGPSEEHEVSLRSAQTVIENLDPSRYQVHLVGITRLGGWLGPAASARLLAGSDPAGTGGLPKLPTGIDCVFPVLHGPYGEDGLLQGWLEMLGLPIVGAGSIGSHLAMDKILSKLVLRYHGIPVVSWTEITREEYAADSAACLVRAAKRGFPCFVKPNRMGSSVGITRVEEMVHLPAAIELALQYDERLLVEPEVVGREFEIAILDGEPLVVSQPGEIIAPGWYDYKTKYQNQSAQLMIPAEDLHHGLCEAMREQARLAFKLLRLSGMARADFRIEEHTTRVYLNELNSIPGFTSISMYPKLLALEGISLPHLLDRLVELALHGKIQPQLAQ
jgi:D-alanine-D-alanine ligase